MKRSRVLFGVLAILAGLASWSLLGQSAGTEGADQKRGKATLPLDSRDSPDNAGPVLDQVISAIETSDWSALWAMATPEFQAAVPVAEFSAQMDASISERGRITGVELTTPMAYRTAPDGSQYATAELSLTIQTTASDLEIPIDVHLLLIDGEWRWQQLRALE